MYGSGERIIYLTGPNGMPYAVEVGDALGTGTTATTKPNIFTQILGAVPAILGALFPGGVSKGGTNDPTYTPVQTGTQAASVLSPTLLVALAAVVLVLVLPSKGKR